MAGVAPGSNAHSQTVLQTLRTSGAISQKHVATFDVLGGPLGTHKVTWSQAGPSLTWAMTSPDDSAAIRAAGMKTIFYTNPNRQAPNDPLYTNDESTFAHDCHGSRLYSNQHRDAALMEVDSQRLWLLWDVWIKVVTGKWRGGVFDAIYDDQADEVQYASGKPCNFDWNAWTAASNNMNRTLGFPIIYNALSAFSGYGPTLGVSPTIALNATTIGGEAEGCYSSLHANKPKPTRYEWLAYENTEIQMYGSGKLFLCEGANHTPAASARDLRIYMYASFLLTYNNETSMVSEPFATNTGFHVEPESELIALNPLVPEPNDISGLLLSSGVYGREYGACYLKGTYVGRCAAVVNSSSTGRKLAFPWPGKYKHTLVLHGGGVLDGGTIATNGPPPPAALGGAEAVIVFQ